MESYWAKASIWASQRKTEPYFLGVLYEDGGDGDAGGDGNMTREDDCNSRLQITKNRLFGKYAVKEDAIKLMYSEKTKRIFSVDGDRHYGWESISYEIQEEELPL